MLLMYDAVDASGQRRRDSIEASSPKDAAELLRRKGLYPTRIGPSASATTAAFVSPQAQGRLPLKALVQVTRQVAMLLRAGSAVVPAFSAVQKQVSNPKHAEILGRIVRDLEDGSTLTEALRRQPRSFDPAFCAIVAAGESSGSLTEVFERLANIVGKRRAMQKKILGAMAYPALLIFMCLQIFLVLLFFVLPRFSMMFEQLGVETPATTQFLLNLSSGLSKYWPAVAILAVLAGGGVFWLVSSERGRAWLSNLQLSIPLLGRLRSRLIQGQVFRTMGMLLESRVNVLEALELVRPSTRNRKFQELFDRLESGITSGGRLSTAFVESGLIEPYICQAIHTGEDTGNLGGAMNFVADILDETNEELVNITVKLLEPIILMGMGLFVGGIAAALFVPLFDMTSAMR